MKCGSPAGRAVITPSTSRGREAGVGERRAAGLDREIERAAHAAGLRGADARRMRWSDAGKLPSWR